MDLFQEEYVSHLMRIRQIQNRPIAKIKNAVSRKKIFMIKERNKKFNQTNVKRMQSENDFKMVQKIQGIKSKGQKLNTNQYQLSNFSKTSKEWHKKINQQNLAIGFKSQLATKLCKITPTVSYTTSKQKFKQHLKDLNLRTRYKKNVRKIELGKQSQQIFKKQLPFQAIRFNQQEVQEGVTFQRLRYMTSTLEQNSTSNSKIYLDYIQRSQMIRQEHFEQTQFKFLIKKQNISQLLILRLIKIKKNQDIDIGYIWVRIKQIVQGWKSKKINQTVNYCSKNGKIIGSCQLILSIKKNFKNKIS